MSKVAFIILSLFLALSSLESHAQVTEDSVMVSDTIITDSSLISVHRPQHANRSGHTTIRRGYAQSIMNRYLDSLTVIKQRIFDEDENTDIDLNPHLYQIFGPATYYKGVAHNIFGLEENNLTPLDIEKDQMLMRHYMSFNNELKFHDDQFDSEALVVSTQEKAPAKEDIQSVIKEVEITDNLDMGNDDMDLGLKIVKPNFWKKSGNFGLKFTQNYVSDNWHKGGNNNGTMLASLYLEAKYDDTKKINWENHLDMRLGFVTTSSDTCHSYITDNDRLNFYSKIGIKRTKSWNYTASLDLTTQFMPGYRTNDTRTYSNFLSPLNGTFSIGMDYRPSMKNGNSLSLALLPLSYKIRYIHQEDEDIYRVLNQWVDFKQDWGSKIEFNAKFTLVKNLTWKCRFYCFTSYTYVESEMENVFQYTFSKYISGELFTLWRFDDNRKEDFYDNKLGFFQFKEYLTFGLNYSF